MKYTSIFRVLLPFFKYIPPLWSISCDEILESPEDRRFTLLELRSTPPKEIIQCLAHLSKDKMPMEEAEYIWKTLVKFYDGALNIPDSVLVVLHWVTPVLQPDDYANLTLSNIDVIQNFGLNYNLTYHQLSAIAGRVREDFAGKEPEDYTYYDLAALRQILCAFNKSEIVKIRPSAYREAASILGKLDHCPEEVMQGFATLAVKPRAFGNPAWWTNSTKETVGLVANYLSIDILKAQESFND